MNNDLQINSGIIHLTINGGPTFIEFNPNDILFAEHFYLLMQEFDEKQKEYQERLKKISEDKSVDANGVPSNLNDGLKVVHESCNFIRSKIDVLFGDGTSQKLFGDALVLEQFEQFFNGILPYIQNARNEKLERYAPPADGENRTKRGRGRHNKKMR